MKMEELMAQANAPILYWHDEDGGLPVAAVVSLEFLEAAMDALELSGTAINMGWATPLKPPDGRGLFFNHDHTEPEDREDKEGDE